jgi:hypothetical protein
MKKNLLLLLSLIFSFSSTNAQVELLSLGPGYQNAVFYSLEDGSTQTYGYADWDIAFGVSGQSLAVCYNEGAAGDLGEIELYLAQDSDFATADTIGMQRIYNNELSWSAGAFNHVGNAADPFDFGWGTYNMVTHQVNGSRVFLIKLRSGTYKKLEIRSLISGVYTFRHADLDGSNEIEQTVDKSNFSGQTMAYYSFAADTVLDLEPEQWDILFTRYYTPLPLNDGSGDTLQYLVTGALTNVGIEVAQADGVDPDNVDFNDYTDQFSSELTVIGSDWKFFDLNTFQWSIPTDRVYFLKNTAGEVWQVQFIDFEGASTGGFALQKSLAGTVTSTRQLSRNFEVFTLAPNPARDYLNINFALNTSAQNGQMRIMNTLGKVLWQETISIQQGLNRRTIPLQLSAGTYYLVVQSGNDLMSRPFLVNP